MKKIALRTVLHIEDDGDIRRAVQFGLELMHGVPVRFCSTGKEGLMAAATHPVDLLLLDVMLPEIDGPMALAGLRQHAMHRDTPAIFLTAFAENEDWDYYRSLGACGVIAKPFAPERLHEHIVRILRRATYQPGPPGMWTELSMLNRVVSRELNARLMSIHFAIDQIRDNPRAPAPRLHLCQLVGDLRSIATGYCKHAIAETAHRAQLKLSIMNSASASDLHHLNDIENELAQWAS